MHLKTFHPILLLPQSPRLLLPRLLLFRIHNLHIASFPAALEHPMHLIRHAPMDPIRHDGQELKHDHGIPNGLTDALRGPAGRALGAFGVAQAVGDGGRGRAGAGGEGEEGGAQV